MAGDSGTRIGKKHDEADDRFSSWEYSTSAGVNGGGGGTSRGASPNDARAARRLQDDELGDSAGASAGCRMASFTEPPVETDTCASDVAHGLAEEEEELTDAQGAATAGRVLAAAFSAGRV